MKTGGVQSPRSQMKRVLLGQESNFMFQMQWIDQGNKDQGLTIGFSNLKVISDLAKHRFSGVVEQKQYLSKFNRGTEESWKQQAQTIHLTLFLHSVMYVKEWDES